MALVQIDQDCVRIGQGHLAVLDDGNLPKGVGVLFGVGLAQFALTSPMQSQRHAQAYEVTEAEGVSLDSLNEASDNRFAQ